MRNFYIPTRSERVERPLEATVQLVSKVGLCGWKLIYRTGQTSAGRWLFDVRVSQTVFRGHRLGHRPRQRAIVASSFGR